MFRDLGSSENRVPSSSGQGIKVLGKPRINIRLFYKSSEESWVSNSNVVAPLRTSTWEQELLTWEPRTWWGPGLDSKWNSEIIVKPSFYKNKDSYTSKSTDSRPARWGVRVNVFAAKSKTLSLSLGTHKVKRERTHTSCFLISTVMSWYTLLHTCHNA